MALITNKLAAATAVAAAFSMLAAPVSAVELPTPVGAKAYDGTSGNVQNHRDRDDWDDYDDDWDDDIDAGDVIAGVLVIGAIAAITGAAKRSRQRANERYPYPYPAPSPDAGYRSPTDQLGYGGRGFDGAVDACVDEIERRSNRVGSVDSAARSVEGWHVTGQLENGAPFSCAIDDYGQISDVFIGDSGQSYEGSGGQYDDDYYASARGARQVEPYPGHDGRYEASETPDFEQ